MANIQVIIYVFGSKIIAHLRTGELQFRHLTGTSRMEGGDRVWIGDIVVPMSRLSDVRVVISLHGSCLL
jgi:hypothetical protein